MCFRFIRGLTIAAGLLITTAAVGCTAAILITIILTIRKKGLGLGGIKILLLLGYN